ncbi:MAG: uroporphyrinogen-III synthase [Actinomycetaceae bacterium]|nr:uroporphyrinogen-III synthase [Actinomycetaceae bacterium]
MSAHTPHLRHMRVLVTRPSSDPLVTRIAQLLHKFPLLDVGGASVTRIVDTCPEFFHFTGFDWIIITSKNTVFTLQDYAHRSADPYCEDRDLPALFGKAHICSVGPGTTKALLNAGVQPTWQAEGSAQSIVELWPRQVGITQSAASTVVSSLTQTVNSSLQPAIKQCAPLRIALPGSALTKQDLSVGLQAMGHIVEPITVYTTEAISPLPNIFDHSVDIVVALAGSSVRALSTYLHKYPHIQLVTIGKPSAKVARQCGHRVGAVAATPDAAGLAQAILYVVEQASHVDIPH